MKILSCVNCGGNSFTQEYGFRICNYCKSKYIIQKEDVTQSGSQIALHDDVQRLLRMCEENPAKAGKYASLILDIDPTNSEAQKYLRRR